MEGIARSATVPEADRKPLPPEKHVTAGVRASSVINNEFFNYFNLNPAMDSNNEHLKYVSEWSLNNSKDLGHALKMIKDSEIKLGTPSTGETRLSKLYNYLRMTTRLTDAKTKMSNEIDGIKNKSKAMIAELKSTYDGRLGKISEEFDRVKGEYLRAKSRYNRDAKASSMALRNEYLSQLKELEAMRDAYKGGK